MDGKTEARGWAKPVVLLGGVLDSWMGVFEGVEGAERRLGEDESQ